LRALWSSRLRPPHFACVCAREIQESLRDSVKQLIEDKISDYGLEEHFESAERRDASQERRPLRLQGMWRNPDALKSLEGADIFWGEEANRFSGRSIRLIRPTMRKPGSRMIWSWNPEFDHDPVDKLFRGPAGPPPNAYVREVSYLDNPFFSGTPLQAEMEHDYRSNPAMAEHVWGGQYVQAMDGAYYAAQLREVREEGRVTTLAKDPILPVRAYWDLGYRDATAIWLCQFAGREIRVLDYIEGRGQLLAYYIEALNERGWGKAHMFVPHDGDHITVISPGSAHFQLRAAGFNVQTIPNQGKGAALQRVQAARRLFPRIWFNDTPSISSGLKALAAYHERQDENRNVGLGPEHDWASDPADAFGLMCSDYREPGLPSDAEEWRDEAGRNDATGY
jgi:phage terminase large subunit